MEDKIVHGELNSADEKPEPEKSSAREPLSSWKSLINRLKKPEKAAKKITSNEANIDPDPNPAREKKMPEKASAMVPLLSRRSLIRLAIGFIVGCVLGLGIWFISPSLLGGKMWESNVNIQAINLGSTYISVDSLQSRAAYYADKARGIPFLEYLSQELNKEEPKYAHSIVELNRMITVEYSRFNVTPVFNITVRTPTGDETAFLVSHIPKVFIDFMTAEDNKRQQSTYQKTLDSIDSIKKALIEAQKETVTYQTQIAASDIQNNPTYIALNAKINSLEPELQARSNALTNLIAAGNTGNLTNMRDLMYQLTLQQAKDVGAALSIAQQELKALEEQRSDVIKDAAIITLNAKIRALETELDRYMVGYTVTSGDNTVLRVMGLAEMIATGATNSTDYRNALKKIEVTSTALAEAKKELTVLQGQVSGNTTGTDLDYQIAQARVESLKAALSNLNRQLAQLVSGTSGEANEQEVQAAFERTSTALSEAKKQLAVLKSQVNSDISEANLGIQIAGAKIDNFNRVLSTLNTSLASLAGSTSDITSSLAMGEPLIPMPVLPIPLTTAALFGIIIGVGGGWLSLNFRWLTKVLSSPPEEDTDEAGGG